MKSFTSIDWMKSGLSEIDMIPTIAVDRVEDGRHEAADGRRRDFLSAGLGESRGNDWPHEYLNRGALNGVTGATETRSTPTAASWKFSLVS